jgi:5-carboxymethyl-2-hydroxymuconate isomerase
VPNVLVEYTGNLKAEADIPGLLRIIARTIIEAGEGVFPTAGIRVRALEVKDYVIADDDPEYAFVSITVRVARGRPEDVKKRTFGAVWEAVKAHLALVTARRLMAINMDVEEFGERLAYKQNSLHEKFGTRPFARLES